MKNINIKNYIWILFIILITAAVYSVSIDYPVFNGWDDQRYVLRNTDKLVFSYNNIAYWFTHSCVGCYLPFTMLSYMFDYNLFGLNGFYYHLQNIFWHIAAVLALFLILRNFGINGTVSFLISILFAIHPQRVESVVWISERKDVLCAAFYLWSFYFYTKRKTWISLLLFVCSLFSKPMAVSLPFVIMFYEIYKINKFSAFKSSIKKLWSYFTVLIIFVPVTFISQGSAIVQNIPLNQKLLIVLHNIFWYAEQTIWPEILNPIYPLINLNKSALYFPSIIITVMLIILFLFLKHKKVFILLLLAYLITLAPVSGFVSLGAVDHADRYSYLPSVFILIGIAALLEILIRKHLAFLMLFTFFLVIYNTFLIYKNINYQIYWKSYADLMDYSCSFKQVNQIALIYQGEYALQTENYYKAVLSGEKLLTENSFKNYKISPEQIKLHGHFIKGIAFTELKLYESATNEFNKIFKYCGNPENFTSKMHYISLLKAMETSYNQTGFSLKAKKCRNALENLKKNE